MTFFLYFYSHVQFNRKSNGLSLKIPSAIGNSKPSLLHSPHYDQLFLCCSSLHSLLLIIYSSPSYSLFSSRQPHSIFTMKLLSWVPCTTSSSSFLFTQSRSQVHFPLLAQAMVTLWCVFHPLSLSFSANPHWPCCVLHIPGTHQTQIFLHPGTFFLQNLLVTALPLMLLPQLHILNELTLLNSIICSLPLLIFLALILTFLLVQHTRGPSKALCISLVNEIYCFSSITRMSVS